MSTATLDLTAEDFAAMWSAEFEEHCESQHKQVPPCTHVAVAIKTSNCGARIRICQASLEWNQRVIARNVTDCSRCDEPVGTCWRILPL